MKLRLTKPLIIGKDWHASRAVTIAIHNRRVHNMHRATRRARYRAALDRILTFWKRP